MSEIKSVSIEMVSVNELVPHPKNMHEHPQEQIDRLCKIIEYQGFRTPLTVQRGTNLIVTGHGRLMAAKQLGMSEVPVSYQEFESEEMLYAHIVADNAIGKDTWATLDLGKINSDIIDLGPELDLDMLGLKDFVVEPLDKLEPQCDEDDVPEVVDPITKRGDIWLLGKHRVMCGDSTMIDDVEKLMNGEKANLLHTDPPYNVASDSVNFAADVSKSMNDLSNAEWDKGFKIESFLPVAIASTTDSATYYVWTSHFLMQEILDIFKESLDFNSYLVWSKPNPMPSLSKRHPTWNTELCAYGTRGSKRTVNFPGSGHFLSCREVIKKSDGSHPTQKPLELIEPLIEFSSAAKDLVLDCFLGSGSTLIACEKTERKCFGMELDEHYCDVIINRYMQYTGRDDVILESTGEKYSELKKSRM